MKFLIDRCAGKRVAEWLRNRGHDVREAREEYPDPGDEVLLKQAFAEGRIIVTIDTDFGALVYLGGHAHSGLIRLPDAPAGRRIALMEQILERYSEQELSGAVITVRGTRIRLAGSR